VREYLMWKWLALAATAYGLLGLTIVLAPPQHPPLGAALDWQEILHGLPQQPVPGMQPGARPPPGMAQKPPGMKQPQVLDFEQQQPFFETRPELQAEVVQAADGNHFLRWTPAPEPQRYAALILPWQPAGHEASALALRWRAERPTPVIIGLREADGSVYSVERRATSGWTELAVPLTELRLGPRQTDENNRLDLDQVQELFAVHSSRRQERESGATIPDAIELDDIRLR
jgi:hypothetical protein